MSRFGSRTTAEEALDGASLDGKTVIVTGSSSGIGVETARVLALAGAHVVMACRSVRSAETIAGELRSKARRGTFEVEELDLGDLASVRGFSERFVASGRPLHLLVNNAGIMATPLGQTKQGVELQVGTNHLGHFLLTQLLRPVLERSAPARVVTLSSGIHVRGRSERLFETLEKDPTFTRRRYAALDAYADSKLANILFTRQLAKDLPSSVTALAVHPGVIATNLWRNMSVVGGVLRAVGGLFMKSIPQGAATTIVAATSTGLARESGAYLADCTVVRPSREALRDENAAKLWAISERLVAS
jgi:NAD(P)-dependent dehydrogenase (short-subunit alcohol dehydrogenase family)